MWIERGPYTVQGLLVKAGAAASIKAGEPVIQNTAGDAEYVLGAAADIDTDDTFVGIATSDSNDTATADGTVYVALPSFGTVIGGRALTPGNLASTVRLTKVTIDYASPNYTIDESTTTKGFLQIVDYNSAMGAVYALVDMTEAVNA